MEAGTARIGAAPGAVSLGAARPRYGERIIKALLFLAAVVSVVTTFGIIFSLLGGTLDFFRVDDPGVPSISVGDFLFGTHWAPSFGENASFGVLPLLGGTLLVTGIALVVAVPLGLGTAIYLAEYARPRTRRVLKPVIEILAGIPTIVFGYFALTFFAPEVLKGLLGLKIGTFSALSAGIVMGFMVLPTIASVSEDALTAVPSSLREGAFGLGASKLQVTLRVVFPAALSGVVAAIVLGISRAIGETMIVLLAAGELAQLGVNPLEQYQTMTAFIGVQATGDVSQQSVEYDTIFAVGTALFLLTFAMNAIAIRFVRKYREVYE